MEMSEKENAVLTIIPTGSGKPIKGNDLRENRTK